MHHDPHRHPLLVAPHVQIELCGCGHVHLTVGATTQRFDLPSFRELARLMEIAVERLPQPEPARPWADAKVEA